MPLPGTAGRKTRFLSHTNAAYWIMRSIGFGASHICETTNAERRNAGQRYGRNTARGEASPSSYAAMVRAWPRQRRNTPAPDPNAGGINGHTQPSRCSRVQRPCPPLPARAGVFWFQNGFVLTLQFHYGDRNKGSRWIPCSIKGFMARDPVVWAENSRKRVLLPMGEVCLNAKN